MQRTTTFGLSRRQLLRLGGLSAAAFAGASSLPAMRLVGGGPGGDYKALVCVFLYGGADSFNLLVPTSAPEYATYAASRGDLAEDLASLLPIAPLSPDGATYGLHAAVPELQALFQSGRLAFVANVGSLVQPLSKAEYLSGSFPTPRSLFSHNDQQDQWQSAHAAAPDRTGWAGRVLDRMPDANGASPLSPSIGIELTARLLVGQTTAPYVLGADGTEALAVADEPARVAVLERLLRSRHALGNEFGKVQREAMAIDAYLAPILDGAPAFDGLFPATRLGAQLRAVARTIAVRSQLVGVTRQVFFVGMGDFDTHDDQTTRLPALFAELSSGLGAFQAALDQLGESQNVTTFTHSEFGRTLSSNGQGSDHGWGGHALVLGGSVLGQDVYGTMPDLALGGPDDVGEGRIKPTTGVEQFAATLAKWFGLTPAEVTATFPNLANFGSSDLGFLA